MARSKVSISDIAKQLNISTTTISFILNGKAKEKRISDKLVAKVLKKVKEEGYIPNMVAKGLRTGKTNIIGLMVEDISNPFFASIAKKIEEKAHQNGYKIVYCSTENDIKRAKEFLTMFQTLGVDGCIIAPTMGMEEDIRDLVEKGMDVVLLDRKFRNMSADVVMVNNEEGVYNAVVHLVKEGFKKIAFIALALDKPEKEDRIIGYKEAMEDNGLEAYVFPLPFRVEHSEYVKEITDILKNHQGFDAVLFGTNYLGISGLEAIGELGLKIPEDLAIVSFDDHDLFRIYKPGISAIAQPIEEISQTAIDTLLDRLRQDDKQKVNRMVSLATTLILRGSTEKVAKDKS
ncbi:substrate-binding domain-containing protein [Echinicola marina]|uniref:LacI family DNA-binding transcriptional regulator n=1 Tax=Echinicola marina TaxID=2859768 RepID=UPI001CF70A37|nr:substrate-binding domain-containing protein [Echinicola marina]UCS93355.1 substrate-binding domain-containing protein [Echinicola marina]